MPIDSTQVRVGIAGKFYVAPVGTTAPSNTGSAWPGGWVDLGYLTDDGPALKPTRDTKDIPAWQSYFPVRTIRTSEGQEWTIPLLQRNGSILKLAFGGGSVTALGGGDYRYSPPTPGTVDERAFGIEVVDGSIIDRYVMQRGMVKDLGDVSFKRDEATMFELTIATLSPSSGDVWQVISNDSAMAS